jgi:hypothetical protein
MSAILGISCQGTPIHQHQGTVHRLPDCDTKYILPTYFCVLAQKYQIVTSFVCYCTTWSPDLRNKLFFSPFFLFQFVLKIIFGCWSALLVSTFVVGNNDDFYIYFLKLLNRALIYSACKVSAYCLVSLQSNSLWQWQNIFVLSLITSTKEPFVFLMLLSGSTGMHWSNFMDWNG